MWRTPGSGTWAGGSGRGGRGFPGILLESKLTLIIFLFLRVGWFGLVDGFSRDVEEGNFRLGGWVVD